MYTRELDLTPEERVLQYRDLVYHLLRVNKIRMADTRASPKKKPSAYNQFIKDEFAKGDHTGTAKERFTAIVTKWKESKVCFV